LKFGRVAFDGDVLQRLVSRSKSGRSGGQNCLREIAAFGSVLCRFDQCFEWLRFRGMAPGARRGAIELPNFFKML
jgi:hypothetical protein